MPNKIKNALSGLSQGLGTFERVQSQKAARDNNRATAQAKQATQASLLQESQDRIARQPTVDQAQERNRLEGERDKAEIAELTRNQDFKEINKALADSDVNGNFNTLVNVMKTSKSFSGIYRSLAGIEPMNLSSDEDLRLLESVRQAEGDEPDKPQNDIPKDFQPEDLDAARQFWQDRPELLKQQAKMLRTDGKKTLLDVRAFKGRQGFFAEMNKEQLTTEINKVRLEKAQLDLKNAQNPTTKETSDIQNSKFVAETTGRSLKNVVDRQFVANTAGIKSGQATEASEATTRIFDSFKGGSTEFFNTDFSNRNNKLKVLSEVRKIEKNLGGIDTKIKGRLSSLNKLLGLAGGVTGLTEESTGLFDSFLNDTKKFINEDVAEGDRQTAEASYRQFQVLMKNDVFGSQLTGGEIGISNKAVGTLKEKLPSVLIKFREQVKQIRDDISSIANLQDPILSKFYIGTDQDEVDAIISRLDDSIVKLGGFPTKPSNNATQSEPNKPATTTKFKSQSAEESFNDIFGGN